VDGVVTVCDAVNGPGTLDRGFESVQQVAMADVLVLSKTDLVLPAQAERFRARLAALAPGARIVDAVRGAVPVARLFGHGAPDPADAGPGAEVWVNTPAYALTSMPLPGLGRPAPVPPLPFPAADSLADATPTHGLFRMAPQASLMAAAAPAARHDDRISSVAMEFDAPIHPMILELWIETLIAACGPDILRMKALVWAEGFDTPFVIHGVQHIIDRPVRLERWTGKDRKSRVVIIGRDLPRDLLRESLDVLRTRPAIHELQGQGAAPGP
jgi:G3E family GTPase